MRSIRTPACEKQKLMARKCLIKDIDMDYVDPKTGLTNRELMERGVPQLMPKRANLLSYITWGKTLTVPLLNYAPIASMVMAKMQSFTIRK